MSKIPIFVFVLLLLFGCSTKNGEKSVRESKPNVLVILSDDQGWGDLSYHGNLNLATPNIDSLAINGAVLENFFVQPVCSPTRAEFLTGIYSSKLGVYSTSAGGERMKPDVTTIAELFKKAGYATAAYGKWHNGMQPPYHPNARGFDDFYGFCSGHWGNYFSPILEHNGELVKGKGYLVDDLTDKGIDFVEKNKTKPFFLMLPFNTPHSPMQVPESFWNRFENKQIEMKAKGGAEDENFTRAALAMVENIDWNVGRLMKKLDELELADNTIVVFLSDNGPNSWRWNNGMRGRKGSTDEGGVKSPCFVQWPDQIKKGTKIPRIAAAIDLLPTLASLAGIDPNTQGAIDGKDLSPLLLRKNVSWPERLIYNHWNGKTSIRSQHYRLDAENRLYNIENDNGQKMDISNTMPEFRDSLIGLKHKWEQASLHSVLPKKPAPFTVGHPDFLMTQLPARDAIATGTIERSNRYPNDSFFQNWRSTNDSIVWNVEVLQEGWFEVDLYYTMKAEDAGVSLELNFDEHLLQKVMAKAHNPPLSGMEQDRVPRIESYVKDFISVRLGKIYLKKKTGPLVLKAIEIPGSNAIDFRLLQLRRL